MSKAERIFDLEQHQANHAMRIRALEQQVMKLEQKAMELAPKTQVYGPVPLKSTADVINDAWAIGLDLLPDSKKQFNVPRMGMQTMPPKINDLTARKITPDGRQTVHYGDCECD